MCGRFTLKTPTADICRQLSMFRFASSNPIFSHHRPCYNIAPTDKVLVIRNDSAEKEIKQDDVSQSFEILKMQWGNSFSLNQGKKSVINTRIETLIEKQDSQFTTNIKPCLILADGYYEWKTTEGSKIPYYIYRKDQQLLVFAGVWQQNSRSVNGLSRQLESCTIITRPAIDPTGKIHDRMPWFMDASSGFDLLLDDQTFKDAQKHLKTFPKDWLKMHTVHTRVNRVGVDQPSCVEPVYFHRQNSLF